MEVVLQVTAGPHAGGEHLGGGRGAFVVGRSSQVGLSMAGDSLLSREHFRIVLDPPVCTLEDLGSTNGTKVNGLRVETARLQDGDVIAAGESEFLVRVEETSFNGRPRPLCPGCGQTLPQGTRWSIDWLCATCVGRRRSFPPTDPNYLIERQVGAGGMGAVYLARQLSNRRPVAIKMMVSTKSAPAKAREYFLREMRVLKSLLMPDGQYHPNIVAFYDILELDGQFQLIMEYVAGKNALEWLVEIGMSAGVPARVPSPARKSGDLRAALEAHPSARLSIASAARIGKQLLAALDYAHSRGYVHRDVKPSNVLVMGPEHRPQIKLSDFGLAKSFREKEEFAGLTTQGDIGGSVGFISPDHLLSFRDVKEPADIYCAGVTLYYLLTLKYPYLGFDPKNYGDATMMILEHPALPLRVLRPDAPEGLERVLRKALEKQPQNRWKSAAEMASALRPFIDTSGS